MIYCQAQALALLADLVSLNFTESSLSSHPVEFISQQQPTKEAKWNMISSLCMSYIANSGIANIKRCDNKKMRQKSQYKTVLCIRFASSAPTC